ncbi:MAG TPA: ABC transporter substrate-binding protein [Magnetospirillaceae bacterium]|jgi:branched-chain amino acid transport system substrate-binding protein
MTHKISQSRRRFLATTAATGAVAASGFGFPHIAKAAAPVKIGVLHPVTGAVSYSGTQSRAGALMAIDDINAAGGIKSLGGAKIEASLADAQSKADVGSAEVEKLNEAGVTAIVGGYASFICLATTQAAAKHDLPYIVDVGVADQIMERGLTNTFRFSPGFGACVQQAITGLGAINQGSGQIAKTAVIVHEDSLFGTGTANLLSKALPNIGITVLEVMKHPTPTLDFNNIALRIKQHNPDLIIPANYYNEYVLLARTLQQQKVSSKGIYSVLGGAASQYKFVKEFPEAAAYVMDCNHWFDPKNQAALDLKKKIEAKGLFYTYEVWLNYEAIMYLADALERAASVDRAKVTEALASSTWSHHFMPYGPTKFVKGQNQGAQAVNLQVQDNDIKVILPSQFANAKPVFPMPARG